MRGEQTFLTIPFGWT